MSVYIKDWQRLFNDYVVFGGYPEVVKAKDEETKKEILKNIINTYLEKDIIGLLQIGDFLRFKSLSTILAAQTGQLINYQQLSNDTRTTFERLKRYLSVLEETYIIKIVYPYFKNLTSELKKNPKIYFIDTGLRNYLVNNFNLLDRRSDKGQIVEMFALANCLYALTDEVVYQFWRTAGGAEVDLVIKQGEDVYPLEIKYSSFKKEAINRSFRSFISTYKPKTSLVLTKDFLGKASIDQTKIIFAPLYLI